MKYCYDRHSVRPTTLPCASFVLISQAMAQKHLISKSDDPALCHRSTRSFDRTAESSGPVARVPFGDPDLHGHAGHACRESRLRRSCLVLSI